MKTTCQTLSLLACVASGLPALGVEPDSEGLRFFESKIRPVLVKECYRCHSATSKSKGGLVVDTRVGLREGGNQGPAVVPGKPAESLLLKALRHEGPKMPSGATRLPAEVIADFETWIKSGAPDPRDGPTQAKKGIDFAEGRKHWAFQPLRADTPPVLKDSAWPRSDLDRYVLGRLEAKGLVPAADAAPHVLVRRLHFDLTGLPPTPEAVDAFVQAAAVDRGQAVSELVDRLLASDQFGVHWARHWLDGVRFRDLPGDGKARYRDWVIRALNTDLPYDRFVQMQVAGDLLPPPDGQEFHPDGIIATTFLVLANGDDPVERQIDVVGQQLLGLTLACARCHDHKFDPISQEDYYALAGIFGSTSLRLNGNPRARDGVPLFTTRDQAAAYQKLVQELDATQKELADLERRLAQPLQLLRANRRLQELEKALAGGRGAKNLEAELKQQEAARDKLVTDQKARGWDINPPELARHAEQSTVRDRLQAELLRVPTSCGAQDLPSPQDAPLLLRGEKGKLGPVIPRRFPTVLAGAQQRPLGELTRGSGRLELAHWLTEEQRPLMARVLVNRIWQRLFGEGLVRTPSNFGLQADAPTHPELLDHLARQLITSRWSMKSVIRAIVLSRAYQQTSSASPEALKLDPENRLLGRMNLKRLTLEPFLDSLNLVSGQLTLELQPQNKGSVTAPRALFGGEPRLSGLFDGANPAELIERRTETISAPQMLYLMNNAAMRLRAQKLTALIERDANLRAADDRIQSLYKRLYARPATPPEVDLGVRFIEKSSWSEYCQALLCANEFVFVR